MTRPLAALLPPTLLLVLLSAPPARADGPLDDARRSFRDGAWPEALAAALAVPGEHEDYARARFLAGEIQLLLGDPAAAEASFLAVEERRPGRAPVLVGLGRARLQRGEVAQAVAVLQRAVAADAESARALCFLGLARLRAGDFRRGRAAIAKAVKRAPDDPEIARVAVLAYLDQEEPERATRVAKAFAKRRRGHPTGPFLVALVAEREGEHGAAIEAYEKAIALDPTHLDAHKNLAILCIAHNPLYTDRERTAKALRHFERYVELGGRDAEVKSVYATLKQFLESQGQPGGQPGGQPEDQR